MSAFSFAKQAFGREKPHSSITDWVDILTASNIAEEAYDGIPELVDAINLQAAGTAEASRAIRKKLKHGNPHQQYRALVLLKALVENCGPKFQTSFADGHLTDALKNLSWDSSTDKRVRRKLTLVLASLHEQFNDDPSMSVVAGLYHQCGADARRRREQEITHFVGMPEDKKKQEKDEARQRAKKEKEQAKARKKEEERQRQRQGQNQSQRTPFVFEKEKPKVLASIADASQASSNLVNAIRLVNSETDSVQTNARVQECLTTAKQTRKAVVRYIQLVENEELIGTLIETNDRLMSALEMYENLLNQKSRPAGDISGVTNDLAAAHISVSGDASGAFAERQHAGIDQDVQSREPHLHPDLEDLNFGPLGASSTNLPPPLRPSTRSSDMKGDAYYARGSLSDFSDYSSDEETRGGTSGSASRQQVERDHVDVSDDPEDEPYASAPLMREKDEDPFADPFADAVAVGPVKKW
ncbi:putative VHS domain containing protein [Lyophyllum shimeji]|uniref:VHS domain containing protein n=1 Tax=Lyophyllum shimeji TaxID=47721 RepID=A0A9P3PI96_LYOSH|nr:putative VHS domain containing protein [Lyophyllum shimeji]